MEKKIKKTNQFNYWEALKIQPSTKMNPLKYVDFYLNRPLAGLIVKAVYNTRITPNMITYVSFFIGLAGAYFFSKGEYRFFVVGGILAQLCSIIDGADGMLARSKNMCSSYGAYLDVFFDRIVDFSLLIGAAIGASSYFNDANLLLLGLIGSGLYMLQINLFYITKSYLNVKQTGETGEMRAVFILAMMIFALINRLDIFAYLGFAETVIVNGVSLFSFLRLGGKKTE